jgi:hypothetical protein
MKRIYFFFLAFLFTADAFSQKNLPEFGQIDKADLLLKSCSFEPDAPAMELFDVRNSEFEPSPFVEKIKTERRVRIKIFNEKGYPYGSVKIPYYSNKKNTAISDIKGMVYNLDAGGNIITYKVDEADFFKDKAIEKIWLLSFAFPNLQPGCVIEYSYTLTEKNTSQFDTWLIQSEIPTAYVSNALIIPTYSDYKEFVFGVDSIPKKTELLKKGLDKNKTTFYKENVPSFKPEPLMSSKWDNMLRMAYRFFPNGNLFAGSSSPLSSWNIAGNMVLRSVFFDEQFKKIIHGTEKIVDTALTIQITEQRIRYLVNTVKNRIPESQGQSWFPDDITDAWKNRSGSSAEINMLLMNLFKRSNINCYPVLISTRDNGKINLGFPNFGQFNGMDVMVADNNLIYFIDASLKFQSYIIAPQNVLNRNVFILNPDNIHWALITDDRPLLKQNASIFGVLTKEGKIKAGVSVSYYDYAKSLFLDSSGINAENNESRFMNNKIPGLKILSDNRENNGDGKPLIQTIEFVYEPQQSDEFFFISPQLLAVKKTNPFILDTRNTDIDFGCNQETLLNMYLEIPEPFSVEHLPPNMVIRLPDSSLIFKRITYADRSSISFSQSLEIRRSVFDKNEYAGVYEFFNRIQSLMAEEIILKKKK